MHLLKPILTKIFRSQRQLFFDFSESKIIEVIHLIHKLHDGKPDVFQWMSEVVYNLMPSFIRIYFGKEMQAHLKVRAIPSGGVFFKIVKTIGRQISFFCQFSGI